MEPAHGAAQEPVYEYAIIGAGVSGLSLAWLLAGSALADRKVLLIDGARDDDELRTLSFWAAGPIALEPLVRHRWQALRLRCGAAVRDVRLEDHSYRTLFFADLQREAKARLLGAGGGRAGHRIVEGRLRSLREHGDGVELQVGEERLLARWAFDSRFQLPALVVDERRYHSLRQHFHGWVVRTSVPCFAVEQATLFDFTVAAGATPSGTAFFYVLPRSPTEALVELVTLEAVDAEPMLRAYLAANFGQASFELGEREAGVSPMTEQPFAWRAGRRVRRLGVAAGRLKPSTGYALTRILDDARAIVASLERHGHPFAGGPRPARFWRLLDAVMLEVWEREPGLIPGIFEALFLRNPPDRVLRFLDEAAGPAEVIRLCSSLPLGPIFRAIGRIALRLLGLRRLQPPPARPPLHP